MKLTSSDSILRIQYLKANPPIDHSGCSSKSLSHPSSSWPSASLPRKQTPSDQYTLSHQILPVAWHRPVPGLKVFLEKTPAEMKHQMRRHTRYSLSSMSTNWNKIQFQQAPMAFTPRAPSRAHGTLWEANYSSSHWSAFLYGASWSNWKASKKGSPMVVYSVCPIVSKIGNSWQLQLSTSLCNPPCCNVIILTFPPRVPRVVILHAWLLQGWHVTNMDVWQLEVLVKALGWQGLQCIAWVSDGMW